MLHERSDAGEIDRAAEFRFEPTFEAVGRGLTHLVIHEQHVLAPLDGLVAAGEDLMGAAAAEKPARSKLARMLSLKPEKPSVTPCSSQ